MSRANEAEVDVFGFLAAGEGCEGSGGGLPVE